MTPVLGEIVGWELLLVLALVALLFGSSQIPKFARSIGEASREFRKGVSDDVSDDRSDPRTRRRAHWRHRRVRLRAPDAGRRRMGRRTLRARPAASVRCDDHCVASGFGGIALPAVRVMWAGGRDPELGVPPPPGVRTDPAASGQLASSRPNFCR